jgi:microcystin-dependent protein
MSGWPTGSAPFFVVVNPGTANEEKICVIYATTTTLTVVDEEVTSAWSASPNGRGCDDTTDRVHAGGATIYPVFTALEANQANLLVSTYANEGGIVYQGSSNPTQLAIGTAGQVLKVNSGATAPEWGQVAEAGIADDAVTTAKIDTGAVTLAKLATALQAFLVPVGTISAYAGATAPTGWLLCNGTSTTGYTALAALVGSTTPDLTGHTLVGKGAAPFDGILLSKLGSTTSTAAHTHGIDHDHASFTSGNDSPDHTHTQQSPTGAATYNPAGTDLLSIFGDIQTGGASVRHQHSIDVPAFTGTSGASSVGSTHGNVQPSALVNFIIKHD